MPDYSSNYGGEPEGSTDTKDSGEKEQEHEDSEQTALLPKSILAGKDFKPGEEVVLKVVHVYEDEVEVEYASNDEKKEPEEKPMQTMKGSDDNLDRMAMSEG